MNVTDSQHPDRQSYDKIWEIIILPYIDEFIQTYKPLITLKEGVKEEIWKNYCYWNQHCKNQYMVYSDGKLDRHKVAACYLISIAIVRPLVVQDDSIIDSQFYDIANELLAISVAFSVLRCRMVKKKYY